MFAQTKKKLQNVQRTPGLKGKEAYMLNDGIVN